MSGIERFIYFSPHFSETVTDSQIINWIDLLMRRGFDFDLVTIIGLKPYFKNRKLFSQKKKEIQKKLGKKIYLFFVLKPNSIFGQLIAFFILYILLFKNIILGQTIAIQTRSAGKFITLRLLKNSHPKLHIIFDSRGAIAEEFLLTKKVFQDGSESAFMKRYNKILRREIDLIRLSDKVFCVSTTLKEYYLQKRGDLDKTKFLVIPSCADQSLFFWNRKLRQKIRQEIGVIDKFVLLYSGKLDQAWQVPDLIFSLFSELNKRYPQLFLICLTPDTNVVKEKIKQYCINEKNIWSNYINYESLNGYYCAADAGLLLRENTITNNVASPTKFAEYLMCGLPVIISEQVGDYSGFVNKNNIGLVINNNEDLEKIANDFKNVFLESNFDRAKISDLCSLYSKQYYLDKIINVYAGFSK